MTRIDQQIVKYLETKPNTYVSREELIKEVWGESKPIDNYTLGTLRVHMVTAREIAESLDYDLTNVKGKGNTGYLLLTQN